jgi:DNA-binding Lrp family transcriptional regulator
LEEAGIIRAYRAIVDEKKLGYEVVVFVMLNLASQAEVDLKTFEDHVRNWNAVRECWTLSGEIDFLLKCVTPDLKTLHALVTELTGLPNVRTIRTAVALERVKDEPIAPLAP